MEDLTQRLPHDVLANVLRRLQKTSTCSLAASRCVCKAWRTVVDTRRLLADLLPHSLTGIFFCLDGAALPGHFSLDASSANIAPFDYLDTPDTTEYLAIRQHCNGLLLLVSVHDDHEPEEAWVVNPATQQWTHLPTPSPMCTRGMEDMDDVDDYMDCHDQYLVFSPTVSPHYEVFLVKYVPFIPWPASDHLVDLHIQEREWPPSTFVLLVYSSKTNQWEERPFVREGEAAGTIDDMLQARPSDHRFAAYWQEVLYFHQRGLFMRIDLSSNKYQIIKPPEGFQKYHTEHYFGKSKNGVYCALVLDDLGLRIWYLGETGDQTNWILKCDSNLQHLLADFSSEHNDRLSKVQCCGNCDEDDRTKTLVGKDLVFDKDSAGSTKDRSKQSYIKYSLLGFHPNEEIVFLHTPLNRVMSYHFDSSEIQDLGCLPVETQSRLGLCFPYTPCLMGEFANNK